ncbi:hypothetical protein LEMLEM_LOCUS16746 [Lemmus lemmus]
MRLEWSKGALWYQVPPAGLLHQCLGLQEEEGNHKKTKRWKGSYVSQTS